jgi:hypothetical protein
VRDELWKLSKAAMIGKATIGLQGGVVVRQSMVGQPDEGDDETRPGHEVDHTP